MPRKTCFWQESHRGGCWITRGHKRTRYVTGTRRIGAEQRNLKPLIKNGRKP